MSPGAMTSPRKGPAVDSKEAINGKSTDLLKWEEEPERQSLSERLHFIDLNPSMSRSSSFSRKGEGFRNFGERSVLL